MLVCTGDIPYIVVIDDIDKVNDVKSNYSWLLQTAKTNKVKIEGNSAKIIGSNKGSVMDIQFPFEESVILRTDPWAGLTVGGAQGNYVPSGYSQTLEAVIPGADTRLVSLLSATAYDESAPIIEVTGTSDNGTIKISYYNGKADVITLNGNNISYQQIDIEILEEPEEQETLSKEELDAQPAGAVTVQISGEQQDFSSLTESENIIYVDVEEFISGFETRTEMKDEKKAQLREAATKKIGEAYFVAMDKACDIIGASYTYDNALRHITIMVKEDVFKVSGSDINISSIQNDKINILKIDTRMDEAQYPPQNAIDGDFDTYFTIQGDTGEPVILELGAEYEIYAVGMAFNQGSKRISRFDVQVSMDKENWETVRCAASSGATEGVEGYSFAKAKAKYVRILGYGNSVNEWNAIREIEIYGKATEVGTTPIPTPTPTEADDEYVENTTNDSTLAATVSGSVSGSVTPTGDDSAIGLWMMLLVGAAIVSVFLGRKVKRTK